MEIERKWMVDGWPALDAEALPLLCTEYQEQGYLHTQAPIVRIRLERRGTDTKYVLCFKSEGLLVRKEIEIEVSKEDFERLSDLIGQPLVDCLIAAFEVVDRHFDTRDVMAFSKSPFSPVTSHSKFPPAVWADTCQRTSPGSLAGA